MTCDYIKHTSSELDNTPIKEVTAHTRVCDTTEIYFQMPSIESCEAIANKLRAQKIWFKTNSLKFIVKSDSFNKQPIIEALDILTKEDYLNPNLASKIKTKYPIGYGGRTMDISNSKYPRIIRILLPLWLRRCIALISDLYCGTWPGNCPHKKIL